MSSGTRIEALRALLAERFPAGERRAAAALPTGVAAIDEAAGGLPRGALTEVVGRAPSCGTQLLFGQVLASARARGGRVALIDAGDEFDPTGWPEGILGALVWVRCRAPGEAMPVADILARDANLEIVAVDLRSAPLPELRKIPPTAWYRLQRAVEAGAGCLLALTPAPLIPSARLRVDLSQPHRLGDQLAPRAALSLHLPAMLSRHRGQQQIA